MSKTIDSKAFWLLFACLTLIGMGNTMLFAVLPPIARTIGMPDWTVSAIFSLSALLWVITSPIWGRISDKTGRKPIIVTGLSAYAASTILFTLVAFFGLYFDWEWLWVVLALALARCIFGAMGSATNPAVQAYVADATSPENRTKEIAALTSAFSFGSAAGPALASAMLSQLGLLSPLWTVSIFAVIGAVAANMFLPKIAAKKIDHLDTPNNIFKIAFSENVFPWLVCGVTLSAVTAVIYQQLSFYFIDRLAVDPIEGASLVAVALSAGAMAQIIAQIGLIPRLRMTPRGLVVAGTIIVACGTCLTIYGNNFGALTSGQILVGLGFGLARPGFTGGASLAVDKKNQGAIAGLVVAANGAGFIVAPIFGAGLYAMVSPQAPFILCTVVLLALALYSVRHNNLGAKTIEESPFDSSGI